MTSGKHSPNGEHECALQPHSAHQFIVITIVHGLSTTLGYRFFGYQNKLAFLCPGAFVSILSHLIRAIDVSWFHWKDRAVTPCFGYGHYMFRSLLGKMREVFQNVRIHLSWSNTCVAPTTAVKLIAARHEFSDTTWILDFVMDN